MREIVKSGSKFRWADPDTAIRIANDCFKGKTA